MTQEEIIEMARQAGGIDLTNTRAGNFTAWVGTGTPEFLKLFAKLVAEHERERIKAANSPEIERVNAHIKELERDAARYREVREWNFCGYDYGLISPESVDREVDNAIGQS